MREACVSHHEFFVNTVWKVQGRKKEEKGNRTKWPSRNREEKSGQDFDVLMKATFDGRDFLLKILFFSCKKSTPQEEDFWEERERETELTGCTEGKRILFPFVWSLFSQRVRYRDYMLHKIEWKEEDPWLLTSTNLSSSEKIRFAPSPFLFLCYL